MDTNNKYLNLDHFDSDRGRKLAAQSNLSQMASDASKWVADNASNPMVSGIARTVEVLTGLDSAGRGMRACGNELKNLFNPED